MAGGSTGTRRPAGWARGRVGAKTVREDLALLPATEPYVLTIDSLAEICSWLGTFRERLRLARDDERAQVAALVQKLEARYEERRAQLS